MMRRAGKPSEQMARLISKSYCSAYCLEGQISIDLVPALPADAPAFKPGSCRMASLSQEQRDQ